jgi:hypothetical protein
MFATPGVDAGGGRTITELTVTMAAPDFTADRGAGTVVGITAGAVGKSLEQSGAFGPLALCCVRKPLHGSLYFPCRLRSEVGGLFRWFKCEWGRRRCVVPVSNTEQTTRQPQT